MQMRNRQREQIAVGLVHCAAEAANVHQQLPAHLRVGTAGNSNCVCIMAASHTGCKGFGVLLRPPDSSGRLAL